jgi:predicted lipid-binding transport protein (Tim44 family)
LLSDHFIVVPISGLNSAEEFMKTLLASILIAVMIFASLGFSPDVEAKKRFGGGQSSGMQRDSVKRDAGTPPKPATPPQAAPATATPGAAPVAAPAASGMRKWLGPLAGLAAGGLLASMLMGHGFDGLKILDMLLMAGIAIAGFMLIRAFLRKRAMSATDNKGSNGMQYAGAGAAYNPSRPSPAEVPAYAPAPVQPNGRIVAPEIGSRLADGNASMSQIEAATHNPRIPADFDVAPFERQAEAAFIRLQAANDAKDLDDIRDFTSPEMFAEISLQLKERGNAVQRTEVVTLSVNVLEVVNENNRAIASVRYTGTIREDAGALPEAFDEVWHVAKNLNDASATWKLAGVQQLA